MSNKYMKNLTFANIAKACEGTYIGDETQLDTTITGAVMEDTYPLLENGAFADIEAMIRDTLVHPWMCARRENHA